MIVDFTKNFRRQYQKLSVKVQYQFDDRLKLFLADPAHPTLRTHPLRGRYLGYWSMNVSGDLRALYVERGDELVLFALVGTHSQLYG